jgi:hypothetical protein
VDLAANPEIREAGVTRGKHPQIAWTFADDLNLRHPRNPR